MTESKQYPSQPLNWFLFMVSLPIALAGIAVLAKTTYTMENWSDVIPPIIWLGAPLYFYTEIMKFRHGFTKVSVKTGKMFKCRVSGTDEIFFLNADTEKEAELFFETMLEGKNVFIEESNIKLMSFDMELPKEENEA